MLLALDTATSTASIALYDLDADQLLAEYTWQARRRQTEEVLPTAQQMMGQLGIQPPALTALTATTGPGSFTGVRIAISTLKGIGLGLPTPPQVIGIPTLSVTAAPWLDAASSTTPATTVCVYIQAGRGRYNWAFFTDGDRLHRPTAAEHGAGRAEVFVETLASLDSAPLWLAGELDTPLCHALDSTPLPHITVLDAVSTFRRAGILARIAALHLAAGTTDDLATLQPLYLRSP